MSHVLRVTAFEVGNPVLFFILMKADDSPWNRRPRTYISPHHDTRRRQCDIVVNCFGVPTWIIPTAPFSASANECVTKG